MAAWPGAAASETEGRLALDVIREVQRTGVGVSWCGAEEDQEGVREVPGSDSCKDRVRGCPLRQRAAQGAGSQEVRHLCWDKVGTGCRNSLSKGAERRRARGTACGTLGCAESSRKRG